MLRKGLSYGWLAARRRIREMVLPVITTATGAFLVVIVFGMSDGIRAQSASLGHADEIGRAVVLIAVTVLLVGVVEVAVATTRTVAHRTRELGVLGALLAAVSGIVLGAVGLVATGVSVEGLMLGAAISIGVSIVAALATSIVPTWNAASRQPIRSLSAGG